MVGQVHLQRRDRDKPLLGGMKIRALAFLFGRTGATDPVHGFAARTGLRDDAFCRMAPAQAADLDTLQLLIGQVGNIHIEQPGCHCGLRAIGYFFQRRHQLLHQLARAATCNLDMAPAFFGL